MTGTLWLLGIAVGKISVGRHGSTVPESPRRFLGDVSPEALWRDREMTLSYSLVYHGLTHSALDCVLRDLIKSKRREEYSLKSTCAHLLPCHLGASLLAPLASNGTKTARLRIHFSAFTLGIGLRSEIGETLRMQPFSCEPLELCLPRHLWLHN